MNNRYFIFSLFLVSLASTQMLVYSEDCKLCHMKKSLKFLPPKHVLTKQHANYSFMHAKKEISCNACHDAENSNYLRTNSEFQASFEKPSAVCQRCHSEEFKDWSRGIHGKISGGWMTKPGIERKVKQCTECHDPHSVRIKPMIPEKAPTVPKLLVPKPAVHEGNK
jgi:hypothetical protein